jgi:DNA-binding MarR family transcriptional regulator
MHQVFFGVKRVHLLGLEFVRGLLNHERLTYPRRLTPARFEMMRIVYVHDGGGMGVPQGNILLLLGVTAPTVSRMLKSLEELGYIVRKRVRYMRGLIVHLTDAGRTLMRSLMKELVDNRYVDDDLDEMVECDDVLPAFDKLLQNFRDVFDDPAPFEHPWRCGLLHDEWPYRFYGPPTHPRRISLSWAPCSLQ